MNERLSCGRTIARLALVIAFLAALAIPVVAFIVRGPDAPETWTLAAAALAVVTSIISAWSSRRVVELQEDAQKPNPYPTFDLTSRFGLALLRVKNTGGTPAHNISLEWVPELENDRGETIGFPNTTAAPAISVLLPGESISQIIGVHHDFFANHPETEFTGHVTFQDPSRHTYRRPFRLDARPYLGTPTHDDEAVKTHYELQKLPKELEGIRTVLEKLLRKSNPTSSQGGC